MNVFSEIKNDRIIFLAFSISLSLIILSFLSILLFYGSLPPVLPLFNQMPWGEQRLAKTFFVFLIPGISISFFVVNLFFVRYTLKEIPLLARLFSFASFLVSVLGFIFIIRTIHIVL